MNQLGSENDPLVRQDGNSLVCRRDEIHAVACIKNEYLRLPFFLQHHRELGVDRFFFIDNGSTDGSQEYVLSQPDCHLFACAGNFFRSNVKPPLWCNAIRNTYCVGHWCVSLDADELLFYPHIEKMKLPSLCAFMDSRGEDALETLMLDMYGQEPLTSATYARGESFLNNYSYFDPELGIETPIEGENPPVLTFSKFRTRAFWTGEYKRQQPPCITKVGLAKWRHGMNYGVSQHVLTKGVFSGVRGVLLHFKFFPGFLNASSADVEANRNVREKSLSERQAYLEAVRRNPQMTLHHEGSARYENSRQLVSMGWMRTTPEFEIFAAKQSASSASAASKKRSIV